MQVIAIIQLCVTYSVEFSQGSATDICLLLSRFYQQIRVHYHFKTQLMNKKKKKLTTSSQHKHVRQTLESMHCMER